MTTPQPQAAASVAELMRLVDEHFFCNGKHEEWKATRRAVEACAQRLAAPAASAEPTHQHIVLAVEMLTSYAELVKTTGKYAEMHYIPEIEFIIGELMHPATAAGEQELPALPRPDVPNTRLPLAEAYAKGSYSADRMRAFYALGLAARRLPAGAWQDIETAPKSEAAPFLVLRRGIVVQVSRFEGRMYPDAKEACIDWSDGITDATHWRPLLATPAQAGEGAA